MTRPSTIATLDHALDGKISALVQLRIGEGRSAAEIRDELRDRHRLTVSARTVQRYIATLEQQ